ncbi:MAG: hypothetical protein K2M05_08730 [Paramuribaculum sp.]|nr:hypothetical protein [Paramuribaculum sp.]
MNLIILLFIAFVGWVVLKVFRIFFSTYSFIRNAKQQAYEAFGFSSDSNQSERRSRRGPSRHTTRKRIDPNVGEYVEYEDLPPINSDPSESSNINYTVEEQITDVEWEEIRN